MPSTVLVTGAAGFIGYHVAQRLLARGDRVIGLDNLNDYYDPTLKETRLAHLRERDSFEFVLLDIADRAGMEALFARRDFTRVVHLAAQAGVRYSLVNPHAYVDANVTGFVNVLEGCRHGGIEHLVYASTSSVYGANTHMPFSEHDGVGHPVSLYAATKRANELMAHTYSHLFRLPTTGLRFFTVYGPWGRPDMALFTFAKSILAGEPIQVFNHGQMRRDFTYVDDIAEGVVRALDRTAAPNPDWRSDAPDPATSDAPFRVYNIGNHDSVPLLRFIEVLEECLGRPAIKQMLPMQPGDVPATYADVDDLARDVGFAPHTPIEVGVRRFAEWYLSYYGAAVPTAT
ncbi:NAD-dependent epimerase/dehydratase [Gemmatirosa kalamazoonensis]|uniref:NAD-dependent epimerase/dehydratase n=1 Tax=Gemmatirosa kalamazoonensis TaxID=861299 RepID=W0RI68_9BACT|nr:NAD-dependent epimerase [Gemmatirosa kalamazoonensis]AHG90030.1 NAD-dependent epimerase/dehydratase [Gemmatirosa kalamazoonensis]